ncbi:glycoside hydrolase [Chytridium lagenaria]|nr:glycoside hydrolase [Chytridium lagenaria]
MAFRPSLRRHCRHRFYLFMEDSRKNGFNFNVSDPVHPPTETRLWQHRQDAVNSAFLHAWSAYSRHAFGSDELLPLSKRGHSWLHLGLTLIDSLDTAIIMNHTVAVSRSIKWIENEFILGDVDVNVGLLSAYHLTGHQVLLSKSILIADALLNAFSKNYHGWPASTVNLKDGTTKVNGEGISVAEALSVQLEMRYLTYVTRNPVYWNAAMDVMRKMDDLDKVEDLAPILVSPLTGRFATRLMRVGAHWDSYFEYLGKQHLLTNQTERGPLRQYQEALAGIKKHLLARTPINNLMYVRELPQGPYAGWTSEKMDHLSCFLPGTIALMASKGRRLTQMMADEREDMYIAEELTRTCYEMYHQTVSGLAPEIVHFRAPVSKDGGVSEDFIKMRTQEDYVPIRGRSSSDGQYEVDFSTVVRDRHNLLRPETVESLFIMWRLTRERKYREWGWRIFRAIEKWARVEDGGYTSLADVTQRPPPRRDHMESFFLSETLKYLYLLFSDDENLFPLEEYVFNTEAHPLPMFEMMKRFEGGLMNVQRFRRSRLVDDDETKYFNCS